MIVPERYRDRVRQLLRKMYVIKPETTSKYVTQAAVIGAAMLKGQEWAEAYPDKFYDLVIAQGIPAGRPDYTTSSARAEPEPEPEPEDPMVKTMREFQAERDAAWRPPGAS